MTNFLSRGPGAVMRRAVIQAARGTPATGVPSASPLAIRPPATFLPRGGSSACPGWVDPRESGAAYGNSQGAVLRLLFHQALEGRRSPKFA
jgi:hypothetical protein